MALNEQALKSHGKSKSIPTVNESSPSIGPMSRATETSEPLTGERLILSISCVEDSHVRTLVRLADAEESRLTDPACGLNTQEPFAHYDHALSLWKTSQVCLSGDCLPFSETWPKWGLMRNGQCYLHAPSVHHIHESGCSLWPTPRASGACNAGGSNSRKTAIRKGTYVPSRINPSLYEWQQGYPIGWTDLEL